MQRYTDPSSDASQPTQNRPLARSDHTATVLEDGKILVAGGFGAGDSVLGLSQLYDVESRRFSMHAFMVQPRAGHTASVVPGGSVLFVGGISTGATFLGLSEVYERTSLPGPRAEPAPGPVSAPESAPAAVATPVTEETTASDIEAVGGFCSAADRGAGRVYLSLLLAPIALAGLKFKNRRSKKTRPNAP